MLMHSDSHQQNYDYFRGVVLILFTDKRRVMASGFGCEANGCLQLIQLHA